MCGLFCFSGNDKKTTKTRISRMPTFRRQLITLSTLVSPTEKGIHKRAPNQICPEHGAKLKSESTGSTYGSSSSDGSELSGCTCTNESQYGSGMGHVHPGLDLLNLASLPLAIHDQLHRVYDEVRGQKDKLLRQDVADFLRNTQGEELVSPLENDEYTYCEFLVEWKRHWNALRPLSSEEKDMSKPISNYYISSSHNTYLTGHQWASYASASQYGEVLEQHCRCIEIDVWNGDISGAASPTRSKSPRPGHQRHKSSASISARLPTVAADTSLALQKKIESAKERMKAARMSATSPTTTADRSIDIVKRMVMVPPEVYLRRQSLDMFTPSVPEFDRSKSVSLRDVDSRLKKPPARTATCRLPFNRREPIVLHGFTFTAPVGFRDVCKSIRKSAFPRGNDLPIIVSLEVHADAEQQEVMVDIMKEEWAGLLLTKPLDGCNPAEKQPTLQDLRGKILIKVKRPPNKATVPAGKDVSGMLPCALDEVGDAEEDSRHESKQKLNNRLDPNHTNQQQKATSKVPICESLSAMAIYTHSQPFRYKFNIPEAKTHSHIFSVAEPDILDIHASRQRSELLAHNRRFFMRAYPDVRRIISDNMDPSLFWRKGVQMVAMNWQTWDEDMALQHAMFTPDTRGWVLKPPGFRSDDSELAIQYKTLDLRITIYAGENIPVPEKMKDERFKPSVKVELIVDKEGIKDKEKAAAAEVKLTTPRSLPTPKLVQEEKFSASAPQLVASQEGRLSTPKLGSESRFSSPRLGSEEKFGSGKAGDGRPSGPREIHYKHKTTVRETRHPNWGPDGFELEFLDIPRVVEQLSFVRFKIEHNSAFRSSDPAAWACLRLDRLLQGYRFIDLVNCKGKPSDGRLFVKVDKVVR